MSPEQYEDLDLDGRSDLFAVGVILYELLCGRKPFGKKRLEILARLFGPEPITAVAELRPELPAELGQIVERLLARSRAGRYANAREALAALPPSRQGRALLIQYLRQQRAAGVLGQAEETDDTEPGDTPGELQPGKRQWRRRVRNTVMTAATAAMALLFAPESQLGPGARVPNEPIVASEQESEPASLDELLCVSDNAPVEPTTYTPQATIETPQPGPRPIEARRPTEPRGRGVAQRQAAKHAAPGQPSSTPAEHDDQRGALPDTPTGTVQSFAEGRLHKATESAVTRFDGTVERQP